MARLATLVREVKRENPNTIFAIGGDFLSPSVESTFLQGAQMVAALDAVGLDFATFGNHEFDFGPAVLAERMKESKFRWLSANVVDRSSGRPFGGASPDTLLMLGGVRVGVFGLTMADAARTSRPGPDIGFNLRSPRARTPPRVSGRRAHRSSSRSRIRQSSRTRRSPARPTSM